MKDEDIISLFKTNRYQVNPSLLKYYNERKGKRYDENVYRYLVNRYDDSSNIEETIYRICKGIEKHPKCPICNNPIKFNKKNPELFNVCCCQKCTNIYLNKIGKLNNKSSIEKAKKTRKQTLKEKYGVENSYQLEKSKLKIKETCLRKYGVDHPMKDETIKNKVKEAIKKSCEEKYGVDNPLSSKEIRQKIENTNIKKYGVKTPLQNKTIHTKAVNQAKEVFQEKYGVDNPWKAKIIQTKVIETKKKNHTFNTSKPEELLYNKLVDKYSKDDVIRQYKSELYPFACDFYIKSKDLYIELQGMWTHGGHPFNPNSKDDLAKLNIWKEKAKTSKFYELAINVWTISDVKKREIVKKNNLNYKEIWNLNE